MNERISDHISFGRISWARRTMEAGGAGSGEQVRRRRQMRMETRVRRREALEGLLIAVDAGGEGGKLREARAAVVSARMEMIGAGRLWKVVTICRVVSGCAQRQRVLADQELENDGVAEVASSVAKGRVPIVAGDCQQALLPRVELGLRDHQLNEFQWRRENTGGRRPVHSLLCWWKTRSAASPSARDWIWVMAACQSSSLTRSYRALIVLLERRG